ncbi:MAG: hypothetical protein DRO95_02855 [Candidatus Altiarchaeales archaeon]|nr:MAG: hypothetical protein DRO95_02855 [Candidatus Altiarchaeales archaeon]
MKNTRKKKSASDIFKDALKGGDTTKVFGGIPAPTVKKKEKEKMVKERLGVDVEKIKEEIVGKTEGEEGLSDMLKDAYDKGLIDKKRYNDALKRIKSIAANRNEIIADIEFVEKDGKPEVIVESGEIDIPKTSEIEVIKKRDEISIIVRRKGEVKNDEFSREIEKLAEIGAEEVEHKDGGEEKYKDIKERLEEIGEIELGEEGKSFLIGEMRDELRLRDLRREFKDDLMEERKREEEKKKSEEEGRGRIFSFINIILKFIRRTTVESKPAKLRRLALENLDRIKEIKDERKAIIGTAYVLKQFLEVRFKITRELTYLELVNDLKNREIDDELKRKLIAFFKRIAIMVYANVPQMDTFSSAYGLAERTIKELT